MLTHIEYRDRGRTISSGQEHIIIIGGGIVGLSTAFALLRQGMKKVTVVEQGTVDHQRSASHGVSRLLRFEYGEYRFYTEMVQVSLQRWKGLEQITQRTLYTPTGVLVLGSPADDFARKSYETLYDLVQYPMTDRGNSKSRGSARSPVRDNFKRTFPNMSSAFALGEIMDRKSKID
jgi:glycine/D-amino acid oxidase-like deaminating enzyme